ncbi:hypothetical protein [Martelella endophytica]|uniref:Uncharacterized protein n=1 Tax=Martelella endophytica TaxID=1486262 RepID=A0A0D5LKD0_MAREN|nr:hypothetical protein [Martelella endophytica]AJY44654.1 hypothetical protein TM49_01485 [Martelella endophytica]
MKDFTTGTDAAHVFRETSASDTLTLDGTGDTGSLFNFMKDSMIVMSYDQEEWDAKIPSRPEGDMDATVAGSYTAR